MKLKEFIEIVDLTKQKTDDCLNSLLYGKDLEKYKDIILSTDEFKECDSLEILDKPLVSSKNGETLISQTIKLSDVMKFRGKCYLLSLDFTPVMYNPNQVLKPVKNGAAIGPTIYDPTTFQPEKYILLSWSPEMVQDLTGSNDEKTIRNNLHKLLDDVLDNPDEYKTKGFRGILVRGLFEVIENDADTVVNKYDIDLKKNKSDANETKERFDNILKKNKELEDRISAEEKHQNEIAKLMKLKKQTI